MFGLPAADDAFIRAAYLIVLGRSVSAVEAAEDLPAPGRHGRHLLVKRLLSSGEFRNRRAAWAAGTLETSSLELELGDIEDPRAFVRVAYEFLLGRPAEEGGLTHYAGSLEAGGARLDVVRALATSDEFERRYSDSLAPGGGRTPHDTQLCELANPAKWDNPEWTALLRDLGLPDDKASMHRKRYELTQLVFGCRRLGVLTSDRRVISVGAGHERVLYWLANHVGHVVAADLYEGDWQAMQGREGDARVVGQPDRYAPFPYRRDRLSFVKMDGRAIGFQNASFDLAYSLSSIEHFGGVHGANETLIEMARVLRPGGILALATEYVLSGPPHPETFQPSEIVDLVRGSGLALVEPIDDRVYPRYTCPVVDLIANPYETPHMVVRFGETVFTTVMLFLRKT
jgi:SAM-dependent methyltransferase